MPDANIVTVTPPTVAAFLGTPVPGDLAPISKAGASRTISFDDAERLIKMSHATGIYNLATGTPIGLGRSVRVVRYSAGGTTVIAWPSGVTVNGVTGAGSVPSLAHGSRSSSPRSPPPST